LKSVNNVVEIVSVYKIYDRRFRRALRFLSLLFSKKHNSCGVYKTSYNPNLFHALENVSFVIPPKHSLGIVGSNGAGKSTLLQIIAGTLKPTSGSVKVNGRVASLLELGSGFAPNFTGRENIILNGSILGLSSNEINERMDSILNFAEIGEFIDMPVKTYSTGMSLRLAFSVIANVDADVLIIDEALAVGDAVFVQKCMRFIREFKKNGTLILVSHDIVAIQSLCEECIWLSKGNLISHGNTEKVTKEYLSHTLLERNNALDKKSIIPDSSHENKVVNIELCSGSAEIKNVNFFEQSTMELINSFIGGELVVLEIKVEVGKEVITPVVGFILRNRLGQDLFSENTYGVKNEIVSTNIEKIDLKAVFIFQMPILKKGSYSLSVAIAEYKENSDFLHHHWMHDALTINSYNESEFNGLVGIPMKSKSLSLEN
jgi:lipopolysaccharide transport system ATP-binding protein